MKATTANTLLLAIAAVALLANAIMTAGGQSAKKAEEQRYLTRSEFLSFRARYDEDQRKETEDRRKEAERREELHRDVLRIQVHAAKAGAFGDAYTLWLKKSVPNPNTQTNGAK